MKIILQGKWYHYVCIFDIQPARDGLVKFYLAMEGDTRIGGVCGFLGLESPPEYQQQVERETEYILELNKKLDKKKEETDKFGWKKELTKRNKAIT